MHGSAPTARIATRLASESYPLSASTAAVATPAIRPGSRGLLDAWDPVSSSATGWPNGVTAAWILVPNRPRLRPNASADWPPDPSAFFRPGGRGSGPDATAAHAQPLGVVVPQGGGDPLPDAG